jgi:TP901 family phage tail tape measure protein
MASSKILKASIIIGGSVSSAFKGAMSSTSTSLKRVGDAIVTVEKRRKLLAQGIDTFGRMGRNVDNMRREYVRLTDQVGKLGAVQRRLNAIEQATVRNRERLHALVGNLTGGHMLGTIASGAAVAGGIRAFEKINDAETDLRVALMDKTGGVPAQFEEIRKQAVELHNVLPGTLADFHNVAVALKENGTSAEFIANGGLKAAAQLGVVLKMPVEQAAEMTAKLRESFQLSENELVRMADLSQRAKFGFGLGSDDLLLGAKYYGSKLGALGLSGAENVRKVYALQGQAAQNGMDGSTFGTNFGMMLSRAAMLPQIMAKNSKQMSAVRDMLHQSKIDLQFFDKKGNFQGIDNLVAQLSKLNVLSQQQRLTVLKVLFGEEGMRPAELIGRKGVAGFQASEKAMDDQASMMQRVDTITQSFTNRVKALTGSLETLVGMAFAPLGEALMPVMTRANQFVSHTLMPWVEHNQKLVGSITAVVGSLVAFKTATTSLSLVRVVSGGGLLKLFGAVERMRAGAALVRLGGAFGMVAEAVGAIAAIGAGPITAIVGALVVEGLLIRKYWQPIKAFFAGTFQGIRDAMVPVFDDMGAALKGLKPAWDVMAGAIGAAWDWLVRMLAPVESTAEGLQGATDAGHAFGTVIGRTMTFGVRVITDVVKALTWLGEGIGNVAGWTVVNITNAWDKVKAIVGAAADWIMAKLQPIIDAGKYVGDAVRGAAAKLGLTDSDEKRASASRALQAVTGRAAPPMPTATARGSAGAVTVQQTNTFHITQQPGESNADLAKRIADEQQRRAAVRGRSNMADMGV